MENNISNMRIPFLLSLVIILCFSGNSFSQQRNIIIDSGNLGVYPPNEPCIAMDFKKPGRLVAGANCNYFYISTDTGYTWFKGNLYTSPYKGGDPVSIVDTNGIFYNINMGSSTLICQRLSNPASHTWTNESYPGESSYPIYNDKPWATIDRNNNQIYLTWSRYDKRSGPDSTDSTNIFFTKSIDTGNTWSPKVRINKIAGDCSNHSKSVEGAMPCAGTNSEIYVAWAHENEILFNRSFDGGTTWMTNEIQVANSPGGWWYKNVSGIYRAPSLPFIVCDNSNGPFRGTVYINWFDQRNGTNNTDIWICKSSDSGTTWSSPIKVNDDTGISQQFMSSMTVDPVTGFVYVLFYDRRNYSDTVSTDVYLAVSKDGAITFQNFKISDTPFSPQQSIFFGDYTDIVAYNNIVRPIWAAQVRVSSSILACRILTAIIDSTITGNSVGIIDKSGYSLQTYPNPFSEKATMFYELPFPEEVSLFLTDITGRKVTTLINYELIKEGRHYEYFNANDFGLTNGIYFLCFKSRNYSKQLKMVLIK